MLNEKTIAALEAKGFKRWTKGSYDRLYIRPTLVGLELDFYNTGNVRNASVNGRAVSNAAGRRIREAKVYIDVMTGKVYCSSGEAPELAENVQKILEEVQG